MIIGVFPHQLRNIHDGSVANMMTQIFQKLVLMPFNNNLIDIDSFIAIFCELNTKKSQSFFILFIALFVLYLYSILLCEIVSLFILSPF